MASAARKALRRDQGWSALDQAAGGPRGNAEETKVLADNGVTDASTDTRDQCWGRNAGDARLQDVIGIVVVVPLPEDCSQVAAVGRTIRERAAVNAVPDILRSVLRVRGISRSRRGMIGNPIGGRVFRSAQQKLGCE
jgi:hypothetical protein